MATHLTSSDAEKLKQLEGRVDKLEIRVSQNEDPMQVILENVLDLRQGSGFTGAVAFEDRSSPRHRREPPIVPSATPLWHSAANPHLTSLLLAVPFTSDAQCRLKRMSRDRSHTWNTAWQPILHHPTPKN